MEFLCTNPLLGLSQSLKSTTILFQQIFAKCILLTGGVYKINKHKCLIQDYDSTYKPKMSLDYDYQAPMFICNHISWLEVFLPKMEKGCPTYLAKDDVQKYPIIGGLNISTQCLFVDRKAKDSKEQTLSKIKERVELVQSNNGFFPIMIYPEGTRTNGRSLLKFAKGAFFTGCPIKMYAVKYNVKNTELLRGIYPLMRLSTVIDLYEFDIYDPIDMDQQSFNPDNWEFHAERLRSVMSSCLKIPKSQSTIRNQFEYREFLKNLSESNNQNVAKKNYQQFDIEK